MFGRHHDLLPWTLRATALVSFFLGAWIYLSITQEPPREGGPATTEHVTDALFLLAAFALAGLGVAAAASSFRLERHPPLSPPRQQWWAVLACLCLALACLVGTAAIRVSMPDLTDSDAMFFALILGLLLIPATLVLGVRATWNTFPRMS